MDSLRQAAEIVLAAAADEECPESLYPALDALKEAVKAEGAMTCKDAAACLTLRLEGHDLLGDTKAEDLTEWFNQTHLDGEDLVRLEALAKEHKFQAWNCPSCGERVYYGKPDDWDHFQGVRNADYTSSPAGHVSHVSQCDTCRCHDPWETLQIPEILR